MLELFVLNPPRAAKSRDKPRKRRISKLRRLKRRKSKLSSDRKSRFKSNSSKGIRMARKTRRKVRRYTRNKWSNDSKGHAYASKLGWSYRRKRKRQGPKGTPGFKKARRAKGRPGRASVRKYLQWMGGMAALDVHRSKHPLTAKAARRRRRSGAHTITIRPRRGMWKGSVLVANKRRKRRQPRNRYGRFARSSRGKSRRYRDNWFVLNPRRRKASSRRRRQYRDNWFVVNKRRRPSRRRSRKARASRRYRNNAYHANPLEQVMENVKGVFSVDFLLSSVLPTAGGFFGTRAIVGGVSGMLGLKLDGIVKTLASFIAASLGGALLTVVFKKPELAGNFMLGGVLGAVNDLIRGVVKDIAFVQESPLLAESFGVSGLGIGTDEDIRRSVEAEVMKELGVGDYLTSQQLARSENVSGMGAYVTTENLAVAERVGQYPAETSGMYGLSQYPRETSGMADLSDVGNAMSDLSSVLS